MVNSGSLVGLVVIVAILIFLFMNRSKLTTFLTEANSKLKTSLTGKADVEIVPNTKKTVTSTNPITKDNVQTDVQTIVFTTKTGGTRVVKNADQGLLDRLKLNFGDTTQ